MLSLCALVALSHASTAALADPAQRHREVQQERERVQQRVDERRGELEQTESRLEQRLGELEDIEAELDVTVEDVQRLDRRITELDARLAELEADLADAEAELEAAEQQLAQTTAELTATEQELQATRDELAEERATFAERGRASFVHGGDAAMLTQVLDAGDVAEFARSMYYVEAVLTDDQERVTRIAALARQVAATKRNLESLRERHVAERAHAERQRDEVAGLVAEEEAIRAEVAAEREEREQAMLALEADRESHEELVASLDRASDEIGAELAELARREAQLTVAEQRLAEERRRAEQRAAQAREEAASRAGGGSGAPASGGQLQRPSNGRLTSGYGYRTHPIHGTRRMHTGIDLAAGYGAPIFAADDGVVVSAGNRGGYGQTVIINHGGGLSTLYAHQSRVAVRGGQQVSRGQVIGYEGATGAVTGAHLHFEVRVGGQHRDPMPYLR